MPVRSRLRGLEAEAFGIVLLEAQACGLPAALGASGGAPEVLGTSASATVVRGDFSQWTQVLTALIRGERDAEGPGECDWARVANRLRGLT
jgi:phosphatidylinositol alpha-1,6-mannosyltransferase